MGVPYAEVIGDPISHSKSPLIHNFWLQKLGIDAEYRACHVRPDELRDYFRQRRQDTEWRGCNVTSPHKIAVLPLVDKIEAEALTAGAANCVLPRQEMLHARSTDGFGVDAAIHGTFDTPCLIGAGGAARAALAALEVLCAPEIRLIARNASRAAVLLAEFGYEGEVFDFPHALLALQNADCVINASPLGMADQAEMPGEVIRGLAHTSKDALVFDMVYAPPDTEFLKEAGRIGRRIMDGFTMLIAQADAAFWYFFGTPAPREHDAELRELLLS